jgi:3-(3-hydroxy-phenyl)propionate hydroxylase
MTAQPEPRIFDRPLYPYARHADQDAAQPVRRRVVVVGAGPVGLAMALEMGLAGVEVVVLDDNDRVSFGSRAICFAKRTLEIFDRLGCGGPMVDKGVVWQRGRVFGPQREVYSFDLLPEDGHRRPAFINLQQYHLEHALVERLRALQAAGAPIDLRGGNRVTAIDPAADHVTLTIDTPEGAYDLQADWVIACDGARSPVRQMMGLDFLGRVFEDNFLIADVVMKADFPTERWFWFDPPFNPGQSALLHRQPDNVWRIDLQLGWNIDRTLEQDPERVRARVRAMLGEAVEFDLEWVSIYTFQCRRMARFRHGRVIFAGDAAHQVSPFGARGANSGVQDIDNLGWKLALVAQSLAPESLLESYDHERIHGADENILNSTRSTDFITPKSDISRVFRDAVLDLAADHAFARPLVNSGRLSVPCSYDGSPLNTPDALPDAPARARPGSACPDAPLDGGYLLDALCGGFTLLGLNLPVPDTVQVAGLTLRGLSVQAGPEMAARYLGAAVRGVYLIRPDQHVAARWPGLDMQALERAVLTATGRCP